PSVRRARDRARRRWSKAHRPPRRAPRAARSGRRLMKRALGLIFLASLLWPILENTGVSLMARHHPLDVVFLRYSAHLLLLLPLVLLRSGPSALATRRPVAQLRSEEH